MNTVVAASISRAPESRWAKSMAGDVRYRMTLDHMTFAAFVFFPPEHGRLLPPDYPATRRRELASIVGSLMHEIAVPSSQQLSLAAPRSRHHPPTPVTTPTRE